MTPKSVREHMSNAEIEAWTHSPEYKRRASQWQRDVEALYADGPPDPDKILAMIAGVGEAFGLPDDVALGVVARWADPAGFAEFIRKSQGRMQ